MNHRLALTFSLWLMFVLTGCLSTSVVEDVSEEDGAPLVGLYKLRALDPVVITLLGIPQETALDAVIDEHGNITLPYVKEPVRAVGMTTSALEREIQRIYTEGEIYRNITVNIQTPSKVYYMEGEIERAQEYSLSQRITLLEAIAVAGGYTEYATPKKVTITRNGQVRVYNAKKIEKHPELDIPIEAGDRIKVYRSFF